MVSHLKAADDARQALPGSCRQGPRRPGALLLTLNKPEGAEPYSDSALREARRVVSVPLSLELWEYSLLDDGRQRTLVKMAGAARP